MSAAPTSLALYVHVPFCSSRCRYCDFHTMVADPAIRSAYVDAVLGEAAAWAEEGLLGDVRSVYVGGGTPTVLGRDLERLVAGLGEIACIRPDAEITVEANPDTTDAFAIERLMVAGVNRVSLGVQSFDDAVLQTLGRRHDAKSAREATEALAGMGVRFSIDLMCGIPGQSAEVWERTLETAVKLRTRHASVYPLSVEEGTPLERAIVAEEMERPDPDAAADMMLAAERVFGSAGLARYEVANYAVPGEESRHNLAYWTGVPYLGLGPSAASMLPVVTGDGDTGGRVRFTKAADTAAYLADPVRTAVDREYLSAEEAAREDVMLGLRLARGVSDAAVVAARVEQAAAGLEEDGLLERVHDGGQVRWRTTERGWLLGNEVFERIWVPDR